MADTDPLYRRVLDRLANPPPVVGVVRLAGVIGGLGPFRRGLTAETVEPLLRRAFGLKRAAGVAIALNSPGGSPVQSSLIGQRIRALADERKLPVYVFAEDVCASGGYWIAAAGDHIYADPSSLIGSIGVISAGFGFPEVLRRLGIERRLYTAGTRKGMLDPFQDENPDDVEHLKALQGDIHAAFMAHVRARRGERLKATDDELFSGSVWTGARALDLGLIDGIGTIESVLRDRVAANVQIKRISIRRPFWRRGPSVVFDDAIAQIEERLAWARFGL